MKKIICLLLAAVVLLLSVGCNQQEPKESAETPLEPLFSNTTGLYSPESKEYDNTPYDTGIGSTTRSLHDIGYMFFEDKFNDITDIVKAKFIGTVKVNDMYFFDFEIKKSVKGNFDSKEISIYLSPMRYFLGGGYPEGAPHVGGYSTYGIPYEVGSDYLLLLERTSTSFSQKDFLCFAHDSLLIPLDSEENPDISKSRMYEMEFLPNIREASAKEKIQNGGLIEYILEGTKNNSNVKNISENMNGTDVLSLYDSAVHVIIVEPKSIIRPQFSYYSYFGNARSVNITKVIKGDIDAESFERNITLPTEMKDGEPYLIMLDKNFSVLSRSAIFPLSGE